MAKFNLVDSFFDKRHGFETAVLCSYGLDLNFFENYLLKLNALYSCENIALFVDGQTYEQFQQAAYVPHSLNRRYLVSWLRSTGVFHAKLYLLASSKKALIAIGSANLTREGIASNLELLTTFEVSDRDRTFGALLNDCLIYVQRLAQLTQSKRAQDQVAALAECCRPFVRAEDKNDSRMQFLHNLDRSLLNGVVAMLNGRSVTRIQIISPFFDGQLAPWGEIQKLWPDCPVEIYIQQHKSNFPLGQFNNVSAAVRLYHDVDRYLHGKAILFHTPEQIYLFMGSANFTAPALLRSAAQGNFEIGVRGGVDEETAVAVLQPTGQTAVPITSVADIQVDTRSEFPPRGVTNVQYLVEAVLENNQIKIEINPAISAAQFQPQRYRLVDFSENSLEGALSPDLTVTLTVEMRKKIQRRFGVQFIGIDEQGLERFSNLVWVIDWDERVGDRHGRQLRRIYSDPSELFNVLEEIMAAGDERELMLFLQRFDIPLDLLLPPRLAQGPRNVKSKGNVIGTLPVHLNKFFSNSVLAAYGACLVRLSGKMKKHLAELQPDKIGNFVLIFNTFLVLLDFVNSWVSEKYRDKPAISNDDWLLIRDCYDMLLKQTTTVWELTWGKDGYRNRINARLAEQVHDEEASLISFEAHLLADYDNSVEELQEFVLRSLRTFEALYAALRIKTQQGKLVQPKVFPNRHLYLEPPQLAGLHKRVSQTGMYTYF
jgi:HKD family nuclease